MSICRYPQGGFAQARGGGVEWALALPPPSRGMLTGSLPISPLSRVVMSQLVSDKISHGVFALSGRCRPGGQVCFSIRY